MNLLIHITLRDLHVLKDKAYSSMWNCIPEFRILTDRRYKMRHRPEAIEGSTHRALNHQYYWYTNAMYGPHKMFSASCFTQPRHPEYRFCPAMFFSCQSDYMD